MRAGLGNRVLIRSDADWRTRDAAVLATDTDASPLAITSDGRLGYISACMVGLSYGGYAALVAAYKTPAQLRCVVSYTGVTDLPTLVRDFRLYRIGLRGVTAAHLSIDSDIQRANSPLHKVSGFGVPALLLHADRDTNVLVEQSRTLVAALQAAGRPHRYIEQRNGDHYLGVQAHRREYLQEMAGFLAAHLRK